MFAESMTAGLPPISGLLSGAALLPPFAASAPDSTLKSSTTGFAVSAWSFNVRNVLAAWASFLSL
jgi:hypothetical protein